jgi:hypothetical protein
MATSIATKPSVDRERAPADQTNLPESKPDYIIKSTTPWGEKAPRRIRLKPLSQNDSNQSAESATN